MAKKGTRSGSGSDGSFGFNQKKVRAYNERLVLSLIQRHGALAKSEITRRSGLSAQAVSVIIGELEKDGLLLRGEPIRGRVGQPSIPMRLNPDGVFSFGLKIGRRSADLILIDFAGQTRATNRITYSYPMPDLVMAFATQGIREMSQKIDAGQQDKIAGIGIALPFHLWDWEDKVGVSPGTMDVWKQFDVAYELEEATGLNAFTQNDCTAACCAEVAFGRGMAFSDSLYIFVGTFVGGGVALNNSIYAGRTQNAGALASMPMPGPDGEKKQLIDFASLFFLEEMLKEKGIDPSLLQQNSYDWSDLGDVLEEWLDKAAHYIALAIASATAIIDFEVAILDGTMPAAVRESLVEKIRDAITEQGWKGIALPVVLEGTLGSPARALGGASLPLFIRYLLDQNMLFNQS
ncbi:Sugar kinase of the NBD/HSP70 family, may contain an N-terminal HTH domain [Cohaesibacter marisflavi]|uniref:Sugar kinase of the NBD/HSP70 family, may contain an N-terminal HTH domain n=1 Tax=Cohaesibacter marisflavi TaxID=655353 RepID=A0A1I5CLW3_9HYPH|nr:ROK family transcriptional regulator [Cohaesibacter marisflavi]SFN88000.1 Sugar kinase of the NBD/HSP70 family, may contain an N-terminal HTH domain [Cohaesibacter marisflavi]